jgi:galactonate dehydratase
VKSAAPGCPPVVDGYFALPTAPGLGVELDVDFVAEHPSTGAFFDLYREGWEKRR